MTERGGLCVVDVAGELAELPDEARAQLAALDEVSRVYERAEAATETQRLYAQRWRVFVRWCQAHRLRPLPAHADVVRLHLVALAQEGRALSTIGATLAAIRKAHKLAHEARPDSERLQDAMAGFRRQLGPKAQRAVPLGVGELRACLATCDQTLAGLRDRALLLAIFMGALRRSEACGCDVRDVQRDEAGIVLVLRQTKTDPSAKGQVVGLPVLDDEDLCPVRAMDAWLDARTRAGGGDGGPLFPSLKGGPSHWRPLSGYDVQRILQAHARAAGFDPKRFRPHGMRAGFATAAARRGASIPALKSHLRHKDLKSTLRYVAEGAALSTDNPVRVIVK